MIQFIVDCHTRKKQYSWENYILVLRTRKYFYQTNAMVWSSELYQYRRSNYTGISERHIALRRIQVRWHDNTIYSDHKQNIMSIALAHSFVGRIVFGFNTEIIMLCLYEVLKCKFWKNFILPVLKSVSIYLYKYIIFIPSVFEMNFLTSQ